MSFLSLLTAPLSLLWGAVAVTRGKLFDWGVYASREFDIPLICVGNLAVGGTGKTPHVEYLLKMLHAEGYRVAMLSRGYGRKTKGYVLATDRHTAAEIGDEPYQIRQNCPFATVAVCEKRVVGVEELLKLRPELDVIVLDDAYQHRYVKAGFNILLTDSHKLYTHDHLLPWGRLREPASAACRAQAVVVTKCTEGCHPALEVLPGQALYYSEICYGNIYPISSAAVAESTDYSGKTVLLIAGIANPRPLLQYIESKGAAKVKVLSFPDHHAFTAADVQKMNAVWNKSRAAADADGGKVMAVTTQKDASRFAEILTSLDSELTKNMYVQPITVRVTAAQEGQQTFHTKILQYVSQNSRNSSVD